MHGTAGAAVEADAAALDEALADERAGGEGSASGVNSRFKVQGLGMRDDDVL